MFHLHVCFFTGAVRRDLINPYKELFYNFHDPNYLIGHARVFTADGGRWTLDAVWFPSYHTNVPSSTIVVGWHKKEKSRKTTDLPVDSIA